MPDMKHARVAGISFDHMHMGDMLRLVHDHPRAAIAGVQDPDPARMARAIADFAIPAERTFTDVDACMAAARPDLVVLCSSPTAHARDVERLAPHGAAILVEKPFASSVDDARRMIAACEAAGVTLAINWPLAWYPCHVTTHRLIGEGLIGDPLEVHFYDGNRGPLYHLADKVEVSPEEVERQKPGSWWYKRAAGGGSLLDYLGYGATLGTWFLRGEVPIEVTSVVDQTPGIEVDQHSITVCRYARGLSRLETRWGTLTDPWTHQPQPKCGFIVVGSHGTISSYDFERHVTVQTRDDPAPRPVPVDELPEDRSDPIGYLLGRLGAGLAPEGPLDPATCLVGQRIVDSAVRSAAEKRTVAIAE